MSITIGRVIGQHHVFVIDAADHQLVLGQPFLLQMRVQLVYKDNDLKCTLHSKDERRTAEFTVCTDTQDKMQLADEFFPESNFQALN